MEEEARIHRAMDMLLAILDLKAVDKDPASWSWGAPLPAYCGRVLVFCRGILPVPARRPFAPGPQG